VSHTPFTRHVLNEAAVGSNDIVCGRGSAEHQELIGAGGTMSLVRGIEQPLRQFCDLGVEKAWLQTKSIP
jgi:hypothetical protein